MLYVRLVGLKVIASGCNRPIASSLVRRQLVLLRLLGPRLALDIDLDTRRDDGLRALEIQLFDDELSVAEIGLQLVAVAREPNDAVQHLTLPILWDLISYLSLGRPAASQGWTTILRCSNRPDARASRCPSRNDGRPRGDPL